MKSSLSATFFRLLTLQISYSVLLCLKSKTIHMNPQILSTKNHWITEWKHCENSKYIVQGLAVSDKTVEVEKIGVAASSIYYGLENKSFGSLVA